MTIGTKIRASRALLIQNECVDPTKGMGMWMVRFPKAYIVGWHIWLFKHCAEEWVEQVNTPYKVEELDYAEAFAFARDNGTLSHLIN